MSVDYRRPVEVVDKDEPDDVYGALLVRPLKGWFNSAVVVWSVNGTIEHANTFDGNGQPVRGGCGFFVRNKVLNDMLEIRMAEVDDNLYLTEQEKFEQKAELMRNTSTADKIIGLLRDAFNVFMADGKYEEADEAAQLLSRSLVLFGSKTKQETFEQKAELARKQVYRDKPTYRDTDGSSIYPAHPLEPPPYQNRWFNPITKEWEYFE